METKREKQIKAELKAVGAGTIGLHSPEGKGLVKILHDDEHIGGVAYGRTLGGLSWLIATDQRVIFYDRKPFFTTTDELTYNVVSGIRSNQAGPFVAVVLHTRLGDYQVRFVRKKCAAILVAYVEERRLETVKDTRPRPKPKKSTKASPPPEAPVTVIEQGSTIDQEAIDFVKDNDLGVLSTIDRTGNVHGAFVYYMLDTNGCVYILTKSSTEKGRDIFSHSGVALTIHEPGTSKTAQLQGVAKIETVPAKRDEIFAQMIKPRNFFHGVEMPPVTKIPEGDFLVVKIIPTAVNYHDYSKVS